MVASDDEYIEDISDGDIQGPGLRTRAGAQAQSRQSRSSRKAEEANNFELTRTWENLTEGADGTITGAVEGLLEAGKRKR